MNHPLTEIGGMAPDWIPAPILDDIATVCITLAERTGISPSSLFLRRRGNERIARTRQLAMTLIRFGTGIPFSQIGLIFSGRNHGTVLHAVKVCRGRTHPNADFRAIYRQITSPHGRKQALHR